MVDLRKIATSRRDYGDLSLREDQAEKNPISQFKRWFEEILEVEMFDPTAMVISTVDQSGHPDSRVVLLKGIENDNFIFYTNYESTKAIQLRQTPYAALNFYWPHMARQVRIRGRVDCASREKSDAYFSTRPLESQLSAIASLQSQEIPDRQWLEDRFNKLLAEHGQEPIIRPQNWGGYVLKPDEIEFWQGRDNRLHDRLRYIRKENEWLRSRLAP